MKQRIIFSALLLSILALSSCEDNKGTEVLSNEVKDITFINATSYTDWVYFSFERGEIVSISDYKNSTSWDIAFHRGDVRLNGGASGIGGLEVVNTKATDWNSVKQIPVSGYVADEIGTITTAFTGDGIITAEEAFSQTLTAWLTVDTSNPPPVYTVHNWIYVVKMGNGKYVKLWLYDNKSEKNAAGYVSFKYIYSQEDSTSFE